MAHVFMKKCWLGGVFFFSLVLVGGCSEFPKNQKQKYSETRHSMATIVQVDVCYQSDQKQKLPLAYEALWTRLEELAWRMNVYDQRSDVAKINQSFQTPIQVERDTYELLQRSVQYYHNTQGSFDITIWPLLKLWRSLARQGQTPDQNLIKETQRAMGPERIQFLPEQKVALDHPQTAIDIGGVAKGYIIDEVAAILKQHEFKQFYIDAGGDIFVGGQNCRQRPWRIGIRDPQQRDQIINIVAVEDQAVTTSGNYEQYIELEGKILSHIMDPIAGRPQAGVISATVIAPTAEEADVLATALTVLGVEKGRALLATKGEGYGAMVITELDDEMTFERLGQYSQYEVSK